jgi:hypothetical protein
MPLRGNDFLLSFLAPHAPRRIEPATQGQELTRREPGPRCGRFRHFQVRPTPGNLLHLAIRPFNEQEGFPSLTANLADGNTAPPQRMRCVDHPDRSSIRVTWCIIIRDS